MVTSVTRVTRSVTNIALTCPTQRRIKIALNAVFIHNVYFLPMRLETPYGSNLRGRIFLQKVVILFLSLKAYYGQVFDPSDKTFAFLI